MQRDLTVRIRVNSETGEVTELNNELRDTEIAANNASSSISGVATKLLAMAGAYTGVSAIVNGFKSLLTEASATEQVLNRFENLYPDMKGFNDALKTGAIFSLEYRRELFETQEAMVLLKSFGIEPLETTLESYTNIAIGSGKSLTQWAEAVGDAFTVENERLKEFGIKGSVNANKVAYAWIDASGKSRSVVVDNNTEIIASTLEAIGNTKYSGLIERNASSMEGLLQRISNQYTNFKFSLMDSELFNYIKGVVATIGNYTQNLFVSLSGGAGVFKETTIGAIHSVVYGVEFLINAWTGIDLAFKATQVGFFAVVNGIGTGINKLHDGFGYLTAGIQNLFKSSLDVVAGGFNDLINWILNGISKFINAASSSFGSVFELIGEQNPFQPINLSIGEYVSGIDTATHKSQDLINLDWSNQGLTDSTTAVNKLTDNLISSSFSAKNFLSEVDKNTKEIIASTKSGNDERDKANEYLKQFETASGLSEKSSKNLGKSSKKVATNTKKAKDEAEKLKKEIQDAQKESEKFADDFKGLFENMLNGDLEGSLNSFMNGISSKLIDPFLTDISSKASSTLTSALSSVDPTGGILSGIAISVTGMFLDDMLNSETFDAFSQIEARVDSDNESVVNSIDILASINKEGLNYSKQMAISLDTMVRSLDTVGSALSLDLQTASGVDSYKQGTLGFSSAKTEFKGSGVSFAEGQTLFDAMDDLEMSLFTDITKTKTKWWGLSTRVSTYSEFEDASEGTVEGIESAIRDGVDVISLGLEGLGLGDQLESVLEQVTLDDLEKIDLTGMTAVERSDFLAQLLGEKLDEVVDKATTKVSLSGSGFWGISEDEQSYLDDFSQRGEGAFETLVRVSSGVEMASKSLEDLGITTIGFRDVNQKSGDIYTELMRDSIVAFEGVDSGLSNIILNSERAGLELVDLYKELGSFQHQLQDLYGVGVEVTQVMLDFGNGLENLSSASDYYYNNLYTDAERLIHTTADLTQSFTDINQAVPSTKEEMRDLIDSFDLMDIEGQKAYASTMLLIESWDAVQQETERLAREQQQEQDRLQREQNALEQAEQRQQEENYRNYAIQQAERQKAIEDAERDRLKAVEETNKEVVKSYQDAFNDIVSAIKSTEKDIENSQNSLEDALESLIKGFQDTFETSLQEIENISTARAKYESKDAISSIDIYSSMGTKSSIDVINMIETFYAEQVDQSQSVIDSQNAVRIAQNDAHNERVKHINEERKANVTLQNEEIERINAIADSLVSLKTQSLEKLMSLTTTEASAQQSLESAISDGNVDKIGKAFDTYIGFAKDSSTSQSEYLQKVASANAQIQDIAVPEYQDPVVVTLLPMRELQEDIQLDTTAINSSVMAMYDTLIATNQQALPNVENQIYNLMEDFQSYVSEDFNNWVDSGAKDETNIEIAQAEAEKMDRYFETQTQQHDTLLSLMNAQSEENQAVRQALEENTAEMQSLKETMMDNTTATEKNTDTADPHLMGDF